MKNNSPKYDELLTRQGFKEYALGLRAGKCCIPGCAEDMVDAHHIVDRKLFSNGGYYPSNCAPVCSHHHIECENGAIRPDQLIKWLGIPYDGIVKPDKVEWVTDEQYRELIIEGFIDKWGN